MREFRYRVLGAKLKVKVLEQEDEVSKGGIILANDIREKEVLEIGEVLELGHLAYFAEDAPWVKVGDIVLFQRYAGKPMREGKDLVRLINDTDIIGIRETIDEEVENVLTR